MKHGHADIKQYEKLEQIGSGAFGNVYKARNKDTGEICAAKILKFNFTDEKKSQKNLNRELRCHRHLKNPAIVEFIGYSDQDFDNDDCPVIFTKYMEKGCLANMFNNIRKGKREGWNNTKMVINILGIALGVKHLHDNEIIHRDLKPSNILLDSDLYPKITDFGTARHLDKKVAKMTMHVGTAQYMAPEVGTEEPYSYEADVFSIGMILYEFYTGKLPKVPGGNTFLIIQNIARGVRPKIDSIPEGPVKELITKCWADAPVDRPSIDEIIRNYTNSKEDFWPDDVDEDEVEQYLSNYGISLDPDNIPRFLIDSISSSSEIEDDDDEEEEDDADKKKDKGSSDDEESDDDKKKKTKSKPSKEKKADPKKIVEDETEEEDEPTSKKKTKSKPSKGKKVSDKKKSDSGSDEEEDEPTSKKKTKSKPSKGKKVSDKKKSDSGSDEDEDEDEPITKKKTKSKPSKGKKVSGKKKSDSGSDEDEPISKKKDSKPSKLKRKIDKKKVDSDSEEEEEDIEKKISTTTSMTKLKALLISTIKKMDTPEEYQESDLDEDELMDKLKKPYNQYYKQAKNKNDLKSLIYISNAFRRGTKPFPKDECCAFKYMKKAALLQSPEALYGFAFFLKPDFDRDDDDERADNFLDALKIAVEFGNERASYLFGYIYTIGFHVEKNDVMALVYLKYSADKRYPPAMLMLANRLRVIVNKGISKEDLKDLKKKAKEILNDTGGYNTRTNGLRIIAKSLFETIKDPKLTDFVSRAYYKKVVDYDKSSDKEKEIAQNNLDKLADEEYLDDFSTEEYSRLFKTFK